MKFVGRRALLLCGAAGGVLVAAGVAAQERSFDIPSEAAVKAIPELARQAGIQIVAPADQLKDVVTPAVKGNLDVHVALQQLIAGTDMQVAADDGQTIILKVQAKKLQAAANEAAAPNDGDALETVVVTAQKRTELLQNVPVAVEALTSRSLDQYQVAAFNDYAKLLPSVSFQTTGAGPGNAQVYMRGVTSGANGNHSGSLPTVGTYLDEMPVTTIGGTLDVHIYDIARVEVLPGPQGTLYGASSEAGTIRIITNKPSTSEFSAGYDVQGNSVEHGAEGYNLQGYVNVPLSSDVAIRLVGWDQRDAGYIDNVLGTRTFATSQATINNAGFVKKDFNPVRTTGGRGALKWDIDDNWSVQPTIMGQEMHIDGVFGYQPDVGYLAVQHFQPDTVDDRWGAAALTVQGKIGDYDLTYAGGYFQRSIDSKNDYTDYSIFYDKAYGSGAYWRDNTGKPLTDPLMEIVGRDRFTKESQELRVASPDTDRLHFIAGAFQQRQTHWVDQGYQIPGFATALAVPGSPNTVWLTDQMRIDRDEALFGEATFEVTKDLSITAGIRGYDYRNSLEGFYGFSAGYDALTGFSSGMGVNGKNCISSVNYRGGPCINLDKSVSGSGETHKVNASYKITPDKLVYFTYSTGFRPGGVNRNGTLPPYQADTLDNYELGWKTSWFDNRLRFNGAAYYETWNQFQYSFLGPNLLTAIENGGQATVTGVESSINWKATSALELSLNGSYNDARMDGPLCKLNVSPCPANDIQAPSGQMLPYTPAFKGNLTARYTIPFGEWTGHVQGALFYQSNEEFGLQSKDVKTYGSQRGYATADFSVGATSESLSLELFVKNAFDKQAALNRYVSCGAICNTSYAGLPRGYYVVPIQPMTLGLRVAQEF